MSKVIRRDPVARRHTPDRFSELAMAIGYLAMDWAGLDATLDFVVESCLGITGDQQSCVAAVLPGIEQRCQLVLRLTHIDPPSPEWRSDMESIVALLQGEMTSRRNRYVHDDWAQDGPDFHRIDKRAVIRKGQSRTPAKLYSRRITPVKLDDIWKLIKLVDDVSEDLWWISFELLDWRRDRHVPALQPRRSLPQTHNRPKTLRSSSASLQLPQQPLPYWVDG